MSSAASPASFQQAWVVARLVARQQATKTRLLALLAIVAIYAVVGWGARGAADRDEALARSIVDVGLSMTVPLVSLLLGAGALGAWRQDKSLVHIWLRRASRLSLTLGALGGCVALALLANLVPLLVLLAVGDGLAGGVLVGGLHATVWMTLVYTSVGSVLSLTIQRPFVVGFLLVLAWDAPVALLGNSLSRLSIMSYGATLLSWWSDTELELGGRALLSAVLVPPLLAVVAVGLSVLRVNRLEIS